MNWVDNHVVILRILSNIRIQVQLSTYQTKRLLVIFYF